MLPWSSDCLLCLASAGGRALCDTCERSLPNPSPRCPQCALPLPAGRSCADCLRNPPAFDDVLTAFDYRLPVDRLVRRFKFSADLAAGAYLGQALARAAGDAAMPDLLIASSTPKEYLTYLEERKYRHHMVGTDHVDLKQALEFLAETYRARTVLTDTG